MAAFGSRTQFLLLVREKAENRVSPRFFFFHRPGPPSSFVPVCMCVCVSLLSSRGLSAVPAPAPCPCSALTSPSGREGELLASTRWRAGTRAPRGRKKLYVAQVSPPRVFSFHTVPARRPLMYLCVCVCARPPSRRVGSPQSLHRRSALAALSPPQADVRANCWRSLRSRSCTSRLG